MSQQEEMKNLTLLGSKETPYIFEYSPQVLESFIINLLDHNMVNLHFNILYILLKKQ